jgi:hypothetical protein
VIPGKATRFAPRVYALTERRCVSLGQPSQAGLLTGTGSCLTHTGREAAVTPRCESSVFALRFPRGASVGRRHLGQGPFAVMESSR